MHYYILPLPYSCHKIVAGDMPCGWKSAASHACLQDIIMNCSKPNKSLLRLANIGILRTLTRSFVHTKDMGHVLVWQCVLRAVG